MASHHMHIELKPWAVVYGDLMARMGGGRRFSRAVAEFIGREGFRVRR